MLFIQRQLPGILRMGLARRTLSTTSAPTASTTSNSTASGDKKLRIVVAVGGNALQRRGDRLTIENMLKAASEMAPTMAELAKKHELGKSKRDRD